MPYETDRIMLQKAKQRLTALCKAVYRTVTPLRVTAWVTPEPVPYADRMTGERLELQPGDSWGELWGCAWFRFQGTVPGELAGEKVVLLIDVNGELCLVDEEGTPRQGLTNINSEFDFSLGLPGKRVVDVAFPAAGGEVIDLWADGGNNDLFGRFRGGTLKEADIAVCREPVRELYYDFEVLIELAEQLPEASSRRAQIVQSLYEAANMLAVIDEETVRNAKAKVAPQLAKRGGDPTITVSAIGHAHIDLAWLWPIRETIRKGARTFSTVLRNMEKYPDYVFGASQPQLYAWMKEHYPKLYGRIKERIREGRWEAQGAMWVEPDTNISGGEALVRQILYGKRFFREEFGQDMKVLWLPDVFGYTGSLPQLLRKSGVDYMMTQKLSWSVYNTHPHHSFLWEGIDGTRVLTHLPPEDTYNSPGAPRSLMKIEQRYLDKGVSEHALMLFGIGDGGGGPGEEHLERLARERDLLGLPPVIQESSLAFFRRLEREAERFQTYKGELYLEKHQGTLTSQARNKWYNRKLEKALRELEFAASLAWALTGAAYPAERLERIWKETLLYQFHDILPGSSITRVFEESLARYAELYREVEAMLNEIYGEIAGFIAKPGRPVLFNSLPWDREDWVQWEGGWHKVSIPAMGCLPLEAALPTTAEEEPALSVLRAADGWLENDRLSIRFDENGGLQSVYDKTCGREALQPGGSGNMLTVYHDDGDAWDFPRDYREMKAGRMKLEQAKAYIDGPRAVMEQEYRYGESTLRQKIMLYEGGSTVIFETEADWRETGKMLRAAFPLNVASDQVNCEIQFGHLKRPTTRNTLLQMAQDEICAHHFIDLSQPDYGVALLNDCKYGHSAEANVIDINLLRSPSYPDETADRARHRFTYALHPHQGDFIRAEVYKKGYELNIPLRAVQASAMGDGTAVSEPPRVAGPFLRLHADNIMVEAVKKAEDSDHLILRLYETAGTAARGTLELGFDCCVIEETDLMEAPIRVLGKNGREVKLDFTPFEIKTIRVELAKS
ncbi:alpha-mannosidase [Paenibacillus faecis]|uniref:alpha-mannosidase n=1 Tax=Paenibacillus faecis TaxID=862114 RepID=UPI001B066781|nr:glycoside hydrolase family 38 C-terminal domain-containing protein [Paenibacillus faecis]GIO85711.1 alpha-mannosidase [Paenibacillus faecis]